MLASGGSRIEWTDIPPEVRSTVEDQLGATVIEARNQSGGFSPGLAARCRLSDGDRVFIKAVSPAQNPMATRIHRREAEVAVALPDSVAVPRVRDVFDDGTWVVLVFEDIEGRQPAEPWTQEDLDTVLPAVRAFSASVTPAPVDGFQSVQDRHRAVFNGWRRLASGDGDIERVDPWARNHLDRLVALEEGWEDAAAGETLLHADLRADNILIDSAGAVWFVDWPWACVGAAFVDLVFLLPSIGLGGGPDPATIVQKYGLFEDSDTDAVLAVTAAVAGFFQRSALDPPPQGLPNLRAFQRASAEVANRWLSTLLAV